MKRLAVWLLAVLTTLLLTTAAMAGTFSIRDAAGTGIVQGSELQTIRAARGDWPFDLKVLVESAPTLDALEDDAHAGLDGPNVLMIAIDPGHHKVVTRFGTGTGVKQGDFDSIAKAGNAHFHAGEWAEGVYAIAMRAKASKESAVAMSTSNTPVVIEHQQGMSTGTELLIVAIVAGFIGLSVWLFRRSQKIQRDAQAALDENRLETAELRSRNVEAMTRPSSYDPPFTPRRASRTAAAPIPVSYSAPSPNVIVQQSGGSDLLTGMLIGEEISRGRDRDVVVERETSRRSSYDSDSGGSSSSFGGSSSSWDSGSSSSSYDSGGSSSSFDTGSSSDFGSSGGGFDSGGGSSDF